MAENCEQRLKELDALVKESMANLTRSRELLDRIQEVQEAMQAEIQARGSAGNDVDTDSSAAA